MSLKQASVEQLVAIVQISGDPAAFNELFSRHQPKLQAFLTFKSADQRAEVDDLMQETYVKAFLNIQHFKQQAQFSTWLLRIAINEMLQAKRSGNIFSRLKERWLSGQQDDWVHHDNIAAQLDATRLIAVLSSQQQQVFICSEFFEYSHVEIAQLLQMPLGSVKTYIKQAREALDRNHQ